MRRSATLAWTTDCVYAASTGGRSIMTAIHRSESDIEAMARAIVQPVVRT